MAYDPKYEEWWELIGEKLCGGKNKNTHYYAYKEGAFNALMKSFREYNEMTEDE